ncbi:hypothetical protein IH575_02870, partial [Candidatus Dojkabacteria bacterium]|nr:hypothetical protein [Candidatus Dojkabacteria bacterium]
GGGYSSIQFDSRTSGIISKFSGITLGGTELNLGILLPFRYKNFELKLKNQFRHIIADSAFLYIFENNLNIGYNFVIKEENIDSTAFSDTKFNFPFSVSIDLQYDYLKIEDNIQPQPAVSLNLEFDPVFLYQTIFK